METNALAEEVTAPEAGGTAASVEAPESGEPKPETKEPKTFSQEEVDALIGKRLAREERKFERERERLEAELRAKRPEPAAQPAPQGKPQPENFKSTEDYLDALTGWKAEQVIEKRLAEREKASKEVQERQSLEKLASTYRQREDAAREVFGDFDEVVYDRSLVITDTMARTIQESERGPEIAYQLGKNPKEAQRIANLSPFLQAKELGRIEAKLPETPSGSQKRPEPPEPISPTRSRGSAPILDTTDPRSIKHMSTSEWIAAENKREAEALRKRGYR